MQSWVGKLSDYFSGRSENYLISMGILLVIIVGGINYLTGYFLSFSIFYLIPVGFVTWFASKRPGIFISIFSAFVWLLADLLTDHIYPHPLIPFWNAILRLGFFLIVNMLLVLLKQALEREHSLARQDYLTRVYNSRAFYETAKTEIGRCRRHHHPLTIVYIDLDNFKSVNDCFGHQTGDRLLTTVGRLIQANTRQIDIVARLGGDEFAILLTETDARSAREMLNRIRVILLAAMKDNDWPVTFSIGMITFACPPDSLIKIIKMADELMYTVKSRGKNRIAHEVVEVHEETL